MFLNFWWTLYPSVNINVYYRMMDFVRTFDPPVQKTFLDNALKGCSPRERKFLESKGLVVKW